MRVRIIPTCVGSTAAAKTQSWTTRDHPHLRGEHAAPLRCASFAAGSSPPAWGAPQRLGDASQSEGIIPTCVGSTLLTDATHRVAGDHPHLRGEHLGRDFAVLFFEGSSPPAWGAPLRSGLRSHPSGIIPTCVGSTRSRSRRAASRPDHPHLRGEHQTLTIGSSPTKGSSPPAWGALCYGKCHCVWHGIIPTCVGSTLWGAKPALVFGDHPHLRGEHVDG